MATGSGITITQIIHDLHKRSSYVTMVWDGQPDKRLGLPIPYATKLEDVAAEAHKALQAFAGEIAVASPKVP
jgi:hypothetical protein